MIPFVQRKLNKQSTELEKGRKNIGRNLSKTLAISSLGLFMGLSLVPKADAIEEISYKVVQKQDNFELRQYSSYLLAETEVNSNFEDAANQAFRKLFRYITGNNQSQKQPIKGEKIAMTAPVIQQEKGEKIAMTAPVIQQEDNTNKDSYLVSFVVPKKYTFGTVPVPKNLKVKIREVPEQLMASIRYSGWWSEDNYQKYKNALYLRIKENGYQVVGKPLYARYDAPFTPWFLRRNEIIVGVEKFKMGRVSQ